LSYQIEILPPSPIFQPYIEYYKNVVTDASGSFKCVPNTSEELYFNFKKCTLHSNNHYTLQDPKVYFTGLHHYDQDAFAKLGNDISGGFGIVFRPNGMQNLFGLSNSELFGYAFEGENIFRNHTEELWHTLKKTDDIESKKARVESFLLSYVKLGRSPSTLLKNILDRIKKEHGILSAGEISEQFNISTRSLERKFSDQIGMSPKEFLQITRLNYALGLIRKQQHFSLTRISYLSGYYDQSHFIRDVEKICGFSPGMLKKDIQPLEHCDNRNFLRLS